MSNYVLKWLFIIRNKLIIKNILDLIEYILVHLVGVISYKSKIFGFFQVFSNGKLISKLRLKKSRALNNSRDEIINAINQKSFKYLGKIDDEKVEKSKNYFLNVEKIFDSHIPRAKKNNHNNLKDFLKKKESNYASYDIATSINCPELDEICKKFKFREIAQKYLNTQNVYVYSINTMLSKKTDNQHGVTKLHRDFDSSNSIVFFIYWTPVSKNDGATSVLPGSHLLSHNKNFHKNFSDFQKLDYLEGPKGSIFALDTWAYHRGNPEILRNRLVTWIRYTAVPAKTYYLDENFLFKKDLNRFNESLI